MRRPDMLLSMEKEFDPAMDVHFCPVCLLFLSRYDHHCPILGACIGKRNLWTFVLFCTYVAMTCTLVVPGTIVFLFKTVHRPLDAPSVEYVSTLLSVGLLKALVVLAVSFFGGGYCAGLSFIYWWRVFNNQHSHASRLRAYTAELEASGGVVPRPKPWLSASCCPQRLDWRAVREMLSEHKGMQLTQTVLDANGSES